jgi:hypothetical protein
MQSQENLKPNYCEDCRFCVPHLGCSTRELQLRHAQCKVSMAPAEYISRAEDCANLEPCFMRRRKFGAHCPDFQVKELK